MSDPIWLPDTQAALMYAAVTGLPVVAWKFWRHWYGKAALCVWALSTSAVVYYSLRGQAWLLAPFRESYPAWQPLLMGLSTGLVIGWLARRPRFKDAGPVALVAPVDRLPSLSASPPRAPVEPPKALEEEHEKTWSQLHLDESLILDRLWAEAESFATVEQLASLRNGLGVTRWKTAEARLKTAHLIEWSSRLGHGKVESGYRLTDKGAVLMMWRTRAQEGVGKTLALALLPMAVEMVDGKETWTSSVSIRNLGDTRIDGARVMIDGSDGGERIRTVALQVTHAFGSTDRADIAPLGSQQFDVLRDHRHDPRDSNDRCRCILYAVQSLQRNESRELSMTVPDGTVLRLRAEALNALPTYLAARVGRDSEGRTVLSRVG